MISKQVPPSPKQRKSILDAFDIRLLGRSKSRQHQHESIKKPSSSTTLHKSDDSDSGVQDHELRIPFVNHSPPPASADDNSDVSKLSAVNLVSNISTAQNWLDLQESDDGGSTDVSKTSSRRTKAKSMVMDEDRGTTTSNVKRNRSWSKIGTRRSRSRSLRSPPPPPDDTQDTPPSLPNVDIEQIRNELIDASHGSTKKRRERRKSTHAADQHLTDNIITNVRHKLGLVPADGKGPQRESHKRTLSSGSIGGITRTTSTTTRQRRRSTTGISSSSRPMPLQKNRSQHDLAANTHLTPPMPPLPTRSSSNSTSNSKVVGKSNKKPGDAKSATHNNSGISTSSEDGGENKDIDTSSQHSLQGKRGESSLMKGAMSLWKRMSFSDQKQKDTTMTSLEHSQANIVGKQQPANSTKKNRRRGKTLPGSLAAPPPPPVLAPPLPPMKMEPLSMDIPKPITTPHEQSSKPSKHADTATSKPAGVKKSFSAAPTPFTTLCNDDWIETPAHQLCGGDSTTHALPVLPSSSTESSSLASSKKTAATTPTTTSDNVATQGRKPLEPWKSKSLPEMNKHGKGQEIPEQEPLSPQLRPQAMFNDSLESITQIPPLHPEATSTDVSMKSVGPSIPDGLQEKLESLIAQNHVHDKAREGIDGMDNLQQSKPPRRRRLSEADINQVSQSSPRKERTPKTCHVVLRYYSQYLSEYERHELLDYDHIYFFGPHARKVKGRPNDPVLNYGYDDERGDYRLVVHDQLAYRYEVLERLGQGSFGQVVRCIDHKTGHSVAVKLIRNKRRFQTQALTEVRILKKLVDWDPDDRCHNIRVLDHFYFRNHMCVVFECLSMNLYEFIKINNFSGFKPSLIRRFTIQLISSLCLLYDHRLAHCDLKPENILLKHPNKTSIKVIDFGSSCFEDERVYTYIQSRFYRAPEVILGMAYGTPIDMWSVGCILAELYTGMPIFPGESEQDQLVCIMEVLGVPPAYMVEQSTRRNLFFDLDGRPRPSFSHRGRKRRPGCKPLIHALGGCHDFLFVDFIGRCLQWDPAHRLRPYDALHHEWIAQHIKRTEGNTQSSATAPPQHTPLTLPQH
ncbi:hypothetical protein O0I10_008962 [Lichtheimia ornata]|uniref:dual-specificity kinase n=1 Tax=Lichtheimia ornata TaxID=688661 RepID=A0AAD7UYH9_9FUNG|nr:uncharacterized protein O0I10_008962 [Lichtheimia ornata]KAJ8655274.1 hypothetical protein O0I10_008962 [Lichtheimia ornata]